MSENQVKNNIKDEKTHYQKYGDTVKRSVAKWIDNNREQYNNDSRQRYANNEELRTRIRERARDRYRRIASEKKSKFLIIPNFIIVE